jgi:hypothetical protein
LRIQIHAGRPSAVKRGDQFTADIATLTNATNDDLTLRRQAVYKGFYGPTKALSNPFAKPSQLLDFEFDN